MKAKHYCALMATMATSALAQDMLPQRIEQAASLTVEAGEMIAICQITAERGNTNSVLTCIEEAQQRLDSARLVVEAVKATLHEWILVAGETAHTDDTPVLTLSRLSKNRNVCVRGDQENTFFIRCLNGITQMGFHIDGCNFGLEERGKRGSIEIGTSPPETIAISGFRGGFYLDDTAPVISQVLRMFEFEEMKLRVNPFDSNQQTIVFDITGLEEAITPLREACHW
ncbi:MAG: hypothetical protein COB08_000780 [Rhodobacteraceae bacterium]|nr:hypothetical protein [Paracoccaceae bacterium]